MSNKFKILFIIMFGLFGCTQLSPSANLGSIRVDISGLPNDIAADIMLSGPGYNKKITSSSTIDGLKPNKYIVSARSFSTNSLKYEAAITQTSVDVTAGKTAMVNIKYSSNKLYQVSVLVTGPGRVKSADNKINCSASSNQCSYEYLLGNSISLTASPDLNFEFDSWSGDSSASTDTINIDIDDNKTVEAKFIESSKRLLNITVNGPGTVTSSDGNIDCSASSNLCSYRYELNTAVSLTATADTDSSFQSWSGACNGSGACELSISDNLELSADFSANTGSQYSIDFVLLGSATDTARKAVFETAASNWSKVIVGQLSSEAIDLQANQACGYGEGAIKQTVNGLLIVATIVPIDGIGGILGQAGPRFIRDGSGLPVIGCMQFDEADIANMETNNSFGGVIMHEMGHVIGIGTLWSDKSLMNDYQPSDACSSSSASFTTKPSFIGTKAIAEYASLGGTGNIPVEDEFGVGTRCGHWDEATFKTELMTGFVASGQMPLSRMTAASLQDMGYGIDISAADSYSLPSIYSTSIDQFELNEELIYPEFKINSFGKILKLK